MNGNRHSRRQDARTGAGAVAWRAPSFSIHAVALLGLLAVFIQSFVVQTHIHIAPGAARAQSIGLTGIGALAPVLPAASRPADAPRDKYPADEDPSNCPLCQEITHSGVYVASASALAALPYLVTFNVIALTEALPSFPALSHSWRGRAPPKA